jgi:hypothetical protein
MTDLEKAKRVFVENVILYPHLTEELADLFNLMSYEIEDGESEENEVNHFMNSVDELLKKEEL